MLSLSKIFKLSKGRVHLLKILLEGRTSMWSKPCLWWKPSSVDCNTATKHRQIITNLLVSTYVCTLSRYSLDRTTSSFASFISISLSELSSKSLIYYPRPGMLALPITEGSTTYAIATSQGPVSNCRDHLRFATRTTSRTNRESYDIWSRWKWLQVSFQLTIWWTSTI